MKKASTIKNMAEVEGLSKCERGKVKRTGEKKERESEENAKLYEMII